MFRKVQCQLREVQLRFRIVLDTFPLVEVRLQDVKKNGPVKHGFFVFHVTDVELTVAERKLDDTWGMTAKKQIKQPNIVEKKKQGQMLV